jgi:thiol-disulfide isomerase/thioredoxin
VRIATPVSLALAMVAAMAAGFGMYKVFSRGTGDATPAHGGLDIQVISRGEPVDLRSHLVPGKYTLFDYYADWCPPCREMAPQLEALVRRQPNLALRKIDIVDWSRPVAEQQNVHDLPYLRLYGPDGRLIQEGDGVFPEVKRLFGFDLPPPTL